MTFDNAFYKSAGDVLTLFLIPWGGGIPAGVVLAKSRGLSWQVMTTLYFISDCILAVLFEPLIHLFIRLSKDSRLLQRWLESYKKMMEKSGFIFGGALRPFSLLAISFGVDPMTGRVAARTAGHGFFSGWALAITGDMGFYILIMGSTLWLDNLLGDGTLTAVIIMLAMIFVPQMIRKLKTMLTAQSPK